MLRKKQGEVEWLEFELFQEIPNFSHYIFLRRGGVSEGPFASLNVGGGTGDEEERIGKNRKKIQAISGALELVSSYQKHGKQVYPVPFSFPPSLESGMLNSKEGDGMITRQKGLGLMIKHADCQAAIFYDPINHAIANVHAGWRGNVQNIYAEAITQMRHAFGSAPENLLVGISPSLGPEKSEFIHFRTELPESFLEFQFKPCYFNLWEISRRQLIDAGILPHHIEIASLCTYSNPQDFFSYRRDKTTGRNATLALLR